MTTTILQTTSCPACHHTLDACTGVNHDHGPKDGDLTLCIGCGSFLVIESLTPYQLRLMTQKEIDELDDATLNLMTKVSQKILTIRQ